MPSPVLEVEPAALAALLLEKPGSVVLLDVRQDWEVELAPFPNAIHIPLVELAARGPAELDHSRPTVVVCHHGVRSLHGALLLKGAGFVDVKSLHGGTDLWARSVDATMPRY